MCASAWRMNVNPVPESPCSWLCSPTARCGTTGRRPAASSQRARMVASTGTPSSELQLFGILAALKLPLCRELPHHQIRRLSWVWIRNSIWLLGGWCAAFSSKIAQDGGKIAGIGSIARCGQLGAVQEPIWDCNLLFSRHHHGLSLQSAFTKASSWLEHYHEFVVYSINSGRRL